MYVSVCVASKWSIKDLNKCLTLIYVHLQNIQQYASGYFTNGL